MSKLVEEWKPVVGYEGLYEVSDWGNVRSLNYNHTNKPRNLSLAEDKDGYLVVCLHKNGHQKEGKVHRLVAEAWIPNPDDKREVGHIKTMSNGLEDKTANEVWNLAWMTREENANYGSINERLSMGKVGNKNPMYGKKRSVETRLKQSISLRIHKQYKNNTKNSRQWKFLLMQRTIN